MISAVYLINLKGEILIYRAYRDDVSRAAADAFRMQVRRACCRRAGPDGRSRARCSCCSCCSCCCCCCCC